jgi:hypothetical protein
VRESYEKARYHNLQNLRKKQKEANGVLDKRTIQAALGKCQPRQRMWGVSGTVILGAKIEVPVDQQLALLEFRKGIHEVDTIVHLSGDEQGVSIWFSGPRQAGDFLFVGNRLPTLLQVPQYAHSSHPASMLQFVLTTCCWFKSGTWRAKAWIHTLFALVVKQRAYM